ncbi:MAG: heavy metal translocating P-type ATPase [Candidatus Methanomethylicia archaeon]
MKISTNDDFIKLVEKETQKPLRYWQRKSIERILDNLIEGREKIILIDLPTGYGKTLIGLSPLIYQIKTSSWKFASWLCYILPTRVLCDSLALKIAKEYLKNLVSEESIRTFHGNIEDASELFSPMVAVTTFDTFLLSYARRTYGGIHIEKPAGFIATSYLVFDESHMINDEYLYSFSLLKAVMERLVDKFSRFYVPIIIFSSVLTVTIGPIFFGGFMDSWLYKSLILIVISCPSAFIISVPATIFIAIIVASKRGILVKGGIYLETMYRVKAILFDKTGTLTLGFPKIHNIKTLNKVDDEILMYVAALERFSNHPIAKAIVKEASRRNLPFEGLRVEGVKEFPGEGIIGYVNGLEVIVGSLNVMLKYSCNCENSSIIFDNDAHMFICVSINRSINASICFFDDVRKEAKFTIESLIDLGVKPMLITGDKFDIAMDVASALGISEVYANLSPEEKLKVIKDVKGKYGFVAMVGDGVNDAPALAASDVGIAMGSGVDVALESADVVLVRNKLNLIQYLVSLSRKTMSIAKQNVFVSIVVKMLLGLFGFLGLIPLWFIVAIGDDGLTLLVLLNSLRLTKLRCD